MDNNRKKLREQGAAEHKKVIKNMNKKFTVKSFQKAKDEKRPISMLTAYDYSMAKILDSAGADALLVGDSLGMVVQGHDSTISVTMEDMIYHAKAVTRGAKRSLVIVDMPFMSYQVSDEVLVKDSDGWRGIARLHYDDDERAWLTHDGTMVDVVGWMPIPE